MNQNMHNWIAIVLGILTVKFITHRHRFNEIKNEVDLIVFIVDITATIMFLAVLFYYMN
ncbi:hypothetical protein HYV10_00080 [Candidatus Dependentiae bacterium]|nr:hypothetical protein [Candidatus Dependentiae bacterium]